MCRRLAYSMNTCPTHSNGNVHITNRCGRVATWS